MARAGFRHAVMAAYPTELTTDLPEHAFLPVITQTVNSQQQPS